jgi:hypothetical protein
MSSKFAKLGDDLMKVPKLEVGGSNWVVYKDRFIWSIDARGLLEHLDGSEKEPVCPVKPRVVPRKDADGNDTTEMVRATLTAQEESLIKDWKGELKEWRQGEAIVKQQIAATIPDSLFMKIRDKGTALEIWQALQSDFQNKSRMVAVDLRRRLQQERCAEKGDVRAHFAKLRTMREDLAAMGHPPGEDEFYAIILGSLPTSFEPFISALNATSSVLGTVLSADELMQAFTDEYDRRNLGKSSKREENVAFSAAEGSRRKGKGRNPKKGSCYNCGKPGHYKDDCWEEGGGKEGQKPNFRSKGKGREEKKEGGDKDKDKGKSKSKESAANAKAEEDAAWMALYLSDSDVEDSDDAIPPISSSNVSQEDLIEADKDTAAYTTVNSAALTKTGNSAIETELFDSGASRHMSGYRHRFINFVEIEPKPIRAADKRNFYATGKGNMYLELPNGESHSTILLRDVLYSPTMGVTLVSIGRITSAGSSVLFSGETCRIFDPAKTLLAQIPKRGGLYRNYTPRPEQTGYAGKAKETLSIDELHRKLGHVGHEYIRQLLKRGLVTGVELDENSKPTFCESCEWGKKHRKPIQKEREGPKASTVGEEIHSDLWGRAPVKTINGKEYSANFTDGHSSHTRVYLMRTKDETLQQYEAYEAWLKTQFGVSIKVFHSDRGGEFMSNAFSKHLQKAGTVRRLTVHDTPEYNGLAERLNRTLIEKVRAILHDTGLPKFLWGEALQYVVYVKNRTWTKASPNATPHEILTGKKPDLSNIHPWGTRVWVHDTSGSKLDGRAKEGRWVGFDEESRGHRVYWENKRSVTVERSVTFVPDEADIRIGNAPVEGEMEEFHELEQADKEGNQPIPQLFDPEPEPEDIDRPNTPQTNDADNEIEVPEPADHVQPEIVAEEETGGRGKRIRKESAYVRGIREGENSVTMPRGLQTVQGEQAGGAGAWEIEEEDWGMAAVMSTAEDLQPTYEEAKRRSDWPKWKEAIQAELSSLEINKTWSVVERPKNANVVSSKWVLRIKKNAAGEVEKYKARLVARGFTQIHGVDYYDTYAPVARLASFRLLLAMANRNGWPADSFDFDSAYLNSVLADDEVIYLEQPPDFSSGDPRKKVFRLHKALYGLKQGAKSWYDSLKEALEQLGFKRTDADHGVFLKTWRDGRVVIVAVHVDDCLTIGTSQTLVDEFKHRINKKYRLTDLGPCKWLLGIKIDRDHEDSTIALSQHAYIDSIVTRFNFDDLKPCSIPMDPSKPLLKSQSPSTLAEKAKMKNVPYREAVGSLMYAAMGTRPDIAFATSTVAQFLENPGWAHWEAVKKIFRYLKGTRGLSLVYGGRKEDLQGWVDADGASQEHRRAITGYVFMVDGGAVSWMSKKQELVTLSTTEAEYVAATHAAKEAVWLRRLFGELFPPVKTATTLHGDNKSAIALATGGQYHARTKHIDIRYHFIRYEIEAGSIRLIYCPTDQQTADTLTKALPSTKVKHFGHAMGLRSA